MIEKDPTKEEIEAVATYMRTAYADMMERMKTVVFAVLNEYPRTERLVAAQGLVGVTLGAISSGIGLTDEESEAFTQEFMAMVLKWMKLGIEHHPELFAEGLPPAMKRPEGS